MTDEPKYTPAPDEPQLTARAIIAGCMVGSVVSCTNVYIALKIGWSFGASIITAVLAYSFFALIGKRLSVLETNIAQTAGSSAGYMSTAAGLVAAIPAMEMLGYTISAYSLILWAISVAFLGVFFAVPLRRQMIDVDQLRFPSGTAAAETILAMFSEASEAIMKARVLVGAGVAAGAYTVAGYFVPQMEQPPIAEWTGYAPLLVAAAYGWQLEFSFGLMGAGLLIGPRVVLSLVLGAIVGWAVLGPLAYQWGWAPDENRMSYAGGVRGWILWPGVALMVCESLSNLALSWRTFLRTFQFSRGNGVASQNDDQQIPNWWWMGGLALGTLLTMTIAWHVFQIAWYLTLLAVALSSILAAVAVRSLGETDINPVGGMGKVTQLVFSVFAPGQVQTNLMSAAITGAGASQAADMMQDLKTGSILGASPRKQFLAQICGIFAGLVFVVPVYSLFRRAYEIGGKELPAPAAHAWRAMAELLTQGVDALPPHTGTAVAVAGAFGALMPILRKFDRVKPWVPSALAMGIAFITPPRYSMIIFVGLMIWWVWKRINASAVERLGFAAAAGLIAGEGLMGIVKAILELLEVPKLTG